MGFEVRNGPSDSGEGHITIDFNAYDSIGAGTWSFALSTSQWFNGAFRNNGSDGDNITYKLFLAKGTYKIVHMGMTTNADGILKVDIDGTTRLTVDGYSAGTVANVRTASSTFVVSSSGIVDLKIKCDGKHASSSNYYIRSQALTLYRTA